MSLIQSLLAASLEEAELVNVVDDETTETLTESLLAAKDATTELHTALDASERLSSTADALTAMTLVDAPNSPLVLAATEAVYLSCGLEAEAAQPGMTRHIWDTIVKIFRTIIISVRNFFGKYLTVYGKYQRILESRLKEVEKFDSDTSFTMRVARADGIDLQFNNYDTDVKNWVIGFEKTTDFLAKLMRSHGGLLSEAKTFLADDGGALDNIRKKHDNTKAKFGATTLIGGFIYGPLKPGDIPTVNTTPARENYDEKVGDDDLMLDCTKHGLIELLKGALASIVLIRRQNELTDAAYERLGKDIEKYEKIGEAPSKELSAYRSEITQQKKNIAGVQTVLLHALTATSRLSQVVILLYKKHEAEEE